MEKGTHSRFPPGPATQDVGLKQGRHKPWLKPKSNEKEIIVRYIRVSLCEKKEWSRHLFTLIVIIILIILNINNHSSNSNNSNIRGGNRGDIRTNSNN